MPLGNILAFFQLQVAFTLLTSLLHPPIDSKCRSQPGDSLFPTLDELSRLNDSIDGRLITVVPFGSFCSSRGGCTDAEWNSSMFRSAVPGAMTNVSLDCLFGMVDMVF